MRLAIVADTHMPRGSRALPERCVEELGRADLILHLGDFSRRSVLAEIEEIGPDVVAVHGNVDEPELVSELPAERIVEAEGVRIGMVHDAGPRDGRLRRMRRRFPDADAVLFGHSHLPLHERDGEFQIFNPGSPTERRRAPGHTMGIGEVSGGKLALELVDLG